MNVDLKSVLDTVRKTFPESIISGDDVTLVKPEISWEDFQAIYKIHTGNPHIRPWFFRSGKSVKVVFFLIEENEKVLPSDTESNFKSKNIIMEKVTKSRDVKSMRKDWDYGGRQFWTVVQWTEEGLAYVIVNRAPSRVSGTPDEKEVMKTLSSSLRPDQISGAVKSTEAAAKRAFDAENDSVFSSLANMGFDSASHEVDVNPLPHFQNFYTHNDLCAANGGMLPDGSPPHKHYPDGGTFTDRELHTAE